MDTCAAIAVVIQVFGFGLVWAFVAGAAATPQQTQEMYK